MGLKYYDIDKNGKILVWVISQTFPLGDADQEDKWKKMEEDEDGYCRDVDYKNLERFFEKEQSFRAKIELKPILINVSYEEFQEEIKNLDNDQTEFHAFIFVFLTYSQPEKQSEYNAEKLHFNHEKLEMGLVPQAKIIDEIKNLNVTKGKPKVFLIQADDLSLLEKETKAKVVPLPPREVIKIPKDSDLLIIKSTIPQREDAEKSQPSFLIQAFLEAMKHKGTTDVFTLTTTINGNVNGRIEKGKSQRHLEGKADLCVPLVTSTLTKLLYL